MPLGKHDKKCDDTSELTWWNSRNKLNNEMISWSGRWTCSRSACHVFTINNMFSSYIITIIMDRHVGVFFEQPNSIDKPFIDSLSAEQR